MTFLFRYHTKGPRNKGKVSKKENSRRKGLYTAKKKINKFKRQLTVMEEIFASHVYDKGLSSPRTTVPYLTRAPSVQKGPGHPKMVALSPKYLASSPSQQGLQTLWLAPH